MTRGTKSTVVGGRKLRPESLMMGYGYDPRLSEGALKCPIFQTSAFAFESAESGKAFFEIAYGLRQKSPGEHPGLIYSRLNNPDLEVLGIARRAPGKHDPRRRPCGRPEAHGHRPRDGAGLSGRRALRGPDRGLQAGAAERPDAGRASRSLFRRARMQMDAHRHVAHLLVDHSPATNGPPFV